MNANYLKLEKGKQIGIRKRILKGNKYYWYSYAIQKVNDIYIVYEHEIAEDNICMEINEYENKLNFIIDNKLSNERRRIQNLEKVLSLNSPSSKIANAYLEIDNLKDKIENGVKKYLVSSIEKNTTIKFAKHRNDAGILGAYYNFCNKHSK